MDTLLAVRSGNTLSLLDIQISRGVHQVGIAPSGSLTLGIPLRSHLFSWRGQNITIPSLLSFGCGNEFGGISRAGFRGLALSISQEYLEDFSARLCIGVDETLLQALAFPATRTPNRLESIAAKARCFLRPASKDMDRNDEEDIITELLLAATDTDLHDDRTTPARRDKAIEKALE